MAKTTQTVGNFVINVLTEDQYKTAKSNGELDGNQLYLTPEDDDYYTKTEIDFKLSNNGVHYYTATLLIDGWRSTNGKFTQTVTCSGISSDMNDNFDQPKTEHSTDASTDAALAAGLRALCSPGYSVTAATGKITWVTSVKPEIDIPVYLSKATTK